MSDFFIPRRLRDEFMGYMEAADNDDLPDGAWFACLEAAGDTFLKTHGLRGDGNDAAHYYVQHCAGTTEVKP